MSEIKGWWISKTTFIVARVGEEDIVKDMSTLTLAERQEVIKQFLVCPDCGYNGNPAEGQGFHYLETIANYRQVVGLKGGDGMLHIEAMYYTGEGYDDGTEHRIECRRDQPHFCGYEFPVPSWMEAWLEWD